MKLFETSRLRKYIENWLDDFSRKRYRGLPDALRDRLNTLVLDKPTLYRCTADSDYVLNWHRVFHQVTTFSNPYMRGQMAEAFASLVRCEVKEESAFDFRLIGSLDHSKSFGRGFCNTPNGSWFTSLKNWGRAMYPVWDDRRPFNYFSDADWEDNIRYIEKTEGWKSDPVKVSYLSWFDRYVGHNTGGSHHTALVIAQMMNQDRRYTRHAQIRHYTLDLGALESLEQDAFLIVTGSHLYDGTRRQRTCAFEKAKDLFSEDAMAVDLFSGKPAGQLLLLPRRSLKLPEPAVEHWLQGQYELGTALRLRQLLEDTAGHCTDPYLHQVDQMYFGDPSRRNDLELNRLQGNQGRLYSSIR